MVVLNKGNCPHCKGQIGIISFYDEFEKKSFVSHGRCVDCFREIPLPQELYWNFIKEYCITLY